MENYQKKTQCNWCLPEHHVTPVPPNTTALLEVRIKLPKYRKERITRGWREKPHESQIKLKRPSTFFYYRWFWAGCVKAKCQLFIERKSRRLMEDCLHMKRWLKTTRSQVYRWPFVASRAHMGTSVASHEPESSWCVSDLLVIYILHKD